MAAAVEKKRDILAETADAVEPHVYASIQERMVAILAELPPIGKTDYNEGQRFHFRSHDSVLNALNPLLAKHGVVVVPDVIERIAETRTTDKGKAMYEVNLHVRYTFHGANGDSLTASAWGEGTDMGDKATNKAMTMAFKAVLAQAFAVSTADSTDSDGDTPEETTGRSKSLPKRVTRGPAGARKTPSASDPADSSDGVKLAASWAEWKERMEVLGVPGRDQASWLAGASGSASEKWGNAQKLLVALTLRDGADFRTNPREIIRDSIAAAFDGLVVDGPPWQIIATETDRPTFEEWKKQIGQGDAA